MNPWSQGFVHSLFRWDLMVIMAIFAVNFGRSVWHMSSWNVVNLFIKSSSFTRSFELFSTNKLIRSVERVHARGDFFSQLYQLDSNCTTTYNNFNTSWALSSSFSFSFVKRDKVHCLRLLKEKAAPFEIIMCQLIKIHGICIVSKKWIQMANGELATKEHDAHSMWWQASSMNPV